MQDNQVAEVKSKTDIAAVIGERITLKKAGRNYKASCPFHGEKTASFMVSPELQIFKCFGCSESGDVYSFLEKFEGMEFPEALKYLADRAGVKLIRSNFGQATDKEKLIDINTQVLKFYSYMLLDQPIGKRVLDYLQNDRGLTLSTIKEFQLGYSPENSFPLSNFLIGKKKFTAKDIELAGVGLPSGANIYDRFNGRVIFPLFDHRGNPVGFSGRVLPWDKRDTGKYINSPETPLYHKSSVLYGLNLTRGNIKKKKVAIVVEGELDLISSYQAGIKNGVAIKGSALTEDQVRLLSRFAPKFILALDSDFAGDAASRRGITVAENSGVEVKVAKLSKFKDPDEAARGDIDSYKNDLIHAESVWDYLIDSVFRRFNASTGEGKAKISKELVPILSEIEDKIVQAHYVNLVAERLRVPLEAVSEQLAKVGDKSVKPLDPLSLKAPEGRGRGRYDLLEERLVILSFQSDPKALLSKSVQSLIVSPVYQKIVAELNVFFDSNKNFDMHTFGTSLPKELFDSYSKVVLGENQELTDKPGELKKELVLVLKDLNILSIKEKRKQLALKMRELETSGDTTELLKIQEEFNKTAKTLSGYEESEASGIILTEK